MIVFHRVLIGTAILFFTMLAFWELSIYTGGGGGAWTLPLAIGSAAAAIGLGYYLKNLKRFLGR
jgi:hypothetical protein